MRNFRRIATSFGTTAIIQMANVVAGALLARELGPSLRGGLASVVSITAVASAVTSLSLGDSIIFFASSKPNGDERAAALRTAISLAMPLSLVGMASAFAFLAILQHKNPATTPLGASLFFCNVAVNHLSLILVGYLLATQDIKWWGIARIIPALTPALGVTPLFLAHLLDANAYLALLFFGNLLTCLVAGLAISRKIKFRQIFPFRIFSNQSISMLRYAASIHVSAISSTAREHLDRVMITLLLPAVALGHYAIAATLATLPVILASTLDTLIFPKASSTSEDKRIGFLATFTPLANWTIIFCSSILLALMPIIIVVIFGRQYAASISISQTLTFSYMLAACKIVCGNFLKSTGHPLALGKSEMLTLAILATTLPLGIHLFGPIGAARAMTLAQATSLLYILYSSSKIHGINILTPFFLDFALIESIARRYVESLARKQS